MPITRVRGSEGADLALYDCAPISVLQAHQCSTVWNKKCDRIKSVAVPSGAALRAEGFLFVKVYDLPDFSVEESGSLENFLVDHVFRDRVAVEDAQDVAHGIHTHAL